MFVARVLLYPLAVLMDIITAVRNRLYDQGLKPSVSFDVPVIGVGNLSVGGTGKTPMIEHLIRLLQDKFQIATLSRGYKRKTKGFKIAGPEDDASTIGDEPFQFFRKFAPHVVVAVGEERAYAIPQILQDNDVNVILLDDGFQHRRVKPSFQILLSDYHSPFFKDFLLPAGRLRESRHNARRADVVVVTKCPDGLSEEEQIRIEAEIRMYSDKPVFFTRVHYGELIAIGKQAMTERKVVLLTGLANAASLIDYVNHNFTLVHHYNFSDHHDYSEEEVKSVCDKALAEGAMVLTTEKDAAKLTSPKYQTWVSKTPFFYLPIEVEFLKDGQDFDEMVLNALKHA